MSTLVTGGAGYVGSALLPVLAERGHELRVLDDFSHSTPRNLMGAPPFEFVRGDVRDPEAVARAVDGVDAVIHLAAITGAADSHDIAEEVRDVNEGGTRTVAEAAAAAGVSRLVFASSCNVYGETHAEHLTEADEPAPGNAISKLAGERACERAGEGSDLETVALRLATNFGASPGVRFNLVVNAFVFRALHGEPLTVYGDGSNWRPFVHVRDTARALADAIAWDPGVYNVGHDNYRIEDVAAAVEDAVDRPVSVSYLAERDPGPSYHVDVSAARGQGLSTERSLAAGVRDLASRFSGDHRVPCEVEP